MSKQQNSTGKQTQSGSKPLAMRIFILATAAVIFLAFVILPLLT